MKYKSFRDFLNRKENDDSLSSFANDINIVNLSNTTYAVVNKLFNEEIHIPDFQRNFKWSIKKQSLLIESILLNIPLPVIYLDNNDYYRWQVIDGVQRLTTLKNFFENKFKLKDLEYLGKELNGKFYKDFEYTPELRKYSRKLKEFPLFLYLIKSDTPDKVVLSIFKRLNTLTTPLTNQELREAIYKGKATELLDELSYSRELNYIKFDSSPNMADRELILRLLSFKIQGLGLYHGKMSDYLDKTMEIINIMSRDEIEEISCFFNNSMYKSYNLFGKRAFRKLNNEIRMKSNNRINKCLFETIALYIEKYSEDYLRRNENIIKGKLNNQMNNFEFIESISIRVDSIKSTLLRHNVISKIFEEL